MKRENQEQELVANKKQRKEKKEKKSKKEQKSKKEEKIDSPTDNWTCPKSLSINKEANISFLAINEIKIQNLSDEEVKINPILEFSALNLPEKIQKNIVYEKPTPIQSCTWSLLFNHKDVVGIAKTGSGKTMAFGLPLILHIHNIKLHQKTNKPIALVLAPTRELAIQIKEQFDLFSKIKSVCIYGGVPKQSQVQLLKQGIDLIVATPGRLIDLFEEDPIVCDLSQVSFFCMDEADRMLDQGFEEAIKNIISKLSTTRQTVMFSATWPPSIQKMALQYLKDPVKITVGSTELTANSDIEQRVEVVDQREKEQRLVKLLKDYHDGKNRILVFALYKKEAQRLLGLLLQRGFQACAIHGDMGQMERQKSLESFRSGFKPILIATDVAARGIDIPDVEYVINVTFPLTVEDYCHRIGRTGRAGKTGISHTLFTVLDKAHSGSLINVLKQAGQVVPDELMKFGTTVKRKVDPNYGVFAKDVDMSLKGTKITFDDSD